MIGRIAEIGQVVVFDASRVVAEHVDKLERRRRVEHVVDEACVLVDLAVVGVDELGRGVRALDDELVEGLDAVAVEVAADDDGQLAAGRHLVRVLAEVFADHAQHELGLLGAHVCEALARLQMHAHDKQALACEQVLELSDYEHLRCGAAQTQTS